MLEKKNGQGFPHLVFHGQAAGSFEYGGIPSGHYPSWHMTNHQPYRFPLMHRSLGLQGHITSQSQTHHPSYTIRAHFLGLTLIGTDGLRVISFRQVISRRCDWPLSRHPMQKARDCSYPSSFWCLFFSFTRQADTQSVLPRHAWDLCAARTPTSDGIAMPRFGDLFQDITRAGSVPGILSVKAGVVSWPCSPADSRLTTRSSALLPWPAERIRGHRLAV
ncbi:uncharacterized protein LY79DRAFT_392233 [Colletotrichum navitas]|uniref:Uncharacterized protein n=1 Tax=Colletotrichum navitas TaxID=681940 RepID=A0AAD8PQZ9_9PEZI|nr:uncharacterized protein LY79DRAFT_392233 [Colletotrichum navitas]KAK1574073.1 hypothetical protein LY79DRAFT_392233 [Colletotrichum navitas]